MSDAVDDVLEHEEIWEELRGLHLRGECDEDCPFCDPRFESLFTL